MRARGAAPAARGERRALSAVPPCRPRGCFRAPCLRRCGAPGLVPATATLAARNVERAPPSLPKQCTLALCTSNLPCNIIKSSSSA